MGDYIFGSADATLLDGSNRDLLVELCVTAGLAIANTFIENPPESQITYYNVGSSPSAAVRHENFAQLDLLLMPPEWLSRVA